MNLPRVSIIDYGVGNHASLLTSLAPFSVPSVTDSADLIRSSDLIVLPGVGDFGFAARQLYKKDLTKILQDLCASGHPFLGICLGMQLFFETSDENPMISGLGLLQGFISSLPHDNFNIGWSKISNISEPHQLYTDADAFFYFNHKYYLSSPHSSLSVSLTADSIPAIISHGNIIGFQFHPEKSQLSGKSLLGTVISSLL